MQKQLQFEIKVNIGTVNETEIVYLIMWEMNVERTVLQNIYVCRYTDLYGYK